MKKYEVTFYYYTDCTVEVEASNETEAMSKARAEICKEEYEKQIMEGLQEEGFDIEEM